MKLLEPKYYDIRPLIKQYPDAFYYMVFGERSNGKTFSSLVYAIENFFKKGEQFAYVRRFGEDVRVKNISTLFDGHIEKGIIKKLSNGEYNGVTYASGKFFTVLTGEEGVIEKSQIPMCYTFDLNAVEHKKSTSYPKITTIIFDEFLSRQGYLVNEFVLFMNTLSTIIRNRKNVKIIMLGNTVNKFCPYFLEMGLKHIKDQIPGTIDVYTYSNKDLKVVVEYCDPMSNKGGKESDVYFAFDNPQLKMITSGAWEVAVYPHLNKKFRPKDVMFNFFIIFDEQILHGKIVVTDTDYFIFIHKKTTPIKDDEKDIIYTQYPDERWNYRVGISNQTDGLSRAIVQILRENRVFYSDNDAGEVLRNFMMWSENYSVIKGGK